MKFGTPGDGGGSSTLSKALSACFLKQPCKNFQIEKMAFEEAHQGQR